MERGAISPQPSTSTCSHLRALPGLQQDAGRGHSHAAYPRSAKWQLCHMSTCFLTNTHPKCNPHRAHVTSDFALSVRWTQFITYCLWSRREGRGNPQGQKSLRHICRGPQLCQGEAGRRVQDGALQPRPIRCLSLSTRELPAVVNGLLSSATNTWMHGRGREVAWPYAQPPLSLMLTSV